MMQIECATLDLPEIVLFPHLGLLPEERANPQEVRLSLAITFSKPLAACLSDDIAGTLCYHNLYDEINALLSRKQFRLIEHLAHTIATIINDEINSRALPSATISLTLHKVSLPLPALPKGASFSLRFAVDSSK
jgi:FolB domain-containing protein